MGCSFSGLNALYDAVNGGGDVWINDNRFRVVRQLGEGGFSYVFLVKEVLADSASASGGGSDLAKKVKDSSHLAGSIPLFSNPVSSFFWDFCDLGHVGVNLKLFYFDLISSEMVLFWDFVIWVIRF